MKKKDMELTVILPNEKAEIMELLGGQSFQKRLRYMGVREGKKIEVVAKQPVGPIIISIDGKQVAIGRGMASKIRVMKI